MEILKALKSFQQKYPKAAVGGSLGLFLHGYDLKRDWGRCDIDIVVPTGTFYSIVITEDCQEQGLSISSSSDFDFIKDSDDFKVNIRVENILYEHIIYEGFQYNVQPISNIVKWKQCYANNGVQKHINDLKILGLYVEPIISETDTDLPF